jgi:hypothetical protein
VIWTTQHLLFADLVRLLLVDCSEARVTRECRFLLFNQNRLKKAATRRTTFRVCVGVRLSMAAIMNIATNGLTSMSSFTATYFGRRPGRLVESRGFAAPPRGGCAFSGSIVPRVCLWRPRPVVRRG